MGAKVIPLVAASNETLSVQLSTLGPRYASVKVLREQVIERVNGRPPADVPRITWICSSCMLRESCPQGVHPRHVCFYGYSVDDDVVATFTGLKLLILLERSLTYPPDPSTWSTFLINERSRLNTLIEFITFRDTVLFHMSTLCGCLEQERCNLMMCLKAEYFPFGSPSGPYRCTRCPYVGPQFCHRCREPLGLIPG